MYKVYFVKSTTILATNKAIETVHKDISTNFKVCDLLLNGGEKSMNNLFVTIKHENFYYTQVLFKTLSFIMNNNIFKNNW